MTAIINKDPISFSDGLQEGHCLKSETKLPKKFVDLFWNIEENKPSEALNKLFSLLTPTLTASSTLAEVVQETQKQWIQKMRWEVKEDSDAIKNLRADITPLFETLGLTSSFFPKGHFDTALLLGARANIFIARCYALATSMKEQNITLSQIEILAGTQLLHPLEIDLLKESSLKITDAKTEAEMTSMVADQLLKPLGIHYRVISTDLQGRKPSTEQIVNTWLEMADRSGQKALIVSDPQFASYQYFQCMEALYKKEITDIHFDLLSIQHPAHVFEELQISFKETQDNPILLHLDTITRSLYTLQNLMNQGL